MKRLLGLLLLGLILSACAGVSAPGAGTCQGGMCVHLQVREPVSLNTPVVISITVQTDEQIPGLEILVPDISSSVKLEGERRWTRDTPARQAIQVTSVLRFTQEGLWHIIVQAHDRRLGSVVADDARIYITRAGGTVYYSGTPIPITPGPLPTLAPGLIPATPIPTPTRRPYP